MKPGSPEFIEGALAMRKAIAEQYAQSGFNHHARAMMYAWNKDWGQDPEHSPMKDDSDVKAN